MARARLLKPGFFANDKLAELPAHCRLLFAGLWTLADREGRLPDRPKWIKGSLFPYENVPVEKYLNQLADTGFIVRYEHETGMGAIQVLNFLKHQTPHIREPASTIPAPVQHCASPAFSRTSPADPVTVTDPVPEAEAETVTAQAPPRPVESAPLHPFAIAYAKRYAERHGGRPPSPVEHGAALALEREYGADACLELAGDLGWQKHPNYMRTILKERRDEPRLQTNGRTPRRGQGVAARAVTDGSDFEDYIAGKI